MAAIGLKSQIWNNNLRSLLLLALYPFILIGIFYLCGAVIGGMGNHPSPQGFANRVVAEYWPLVATITAIWFSIAWFFQTRMIRMVSHSRPVTRSEEPELYNMLENLCISRGLKMPKLEIIESHARNAFASGTNDRTYTITVTRGLLSALQPDEVEAVLGHELTHIINRDVRLLVVSVIFTGMIGFLAQMMWSNLRYGLVFSRPSGRNGNRGSPVMLYFAILGILVIGYLASLLARFALSRSREFMADAGAIELTRNPEAMMRALLRISGRDKIPQATDDIALMCIENSVPFMGLFATHPPIETRVRAISQTTGTPIPVLLPHAPAIPGQRFQNPGDRHPDWANRTKNKLRNPWA